MTSSPGLFSFILRKPTTAGTRSPAFFGYYFLSVSRILLFPFSHLRLSTLPALPKPSNFRFFACSRANSSKSLLSSLIASPAPLQLFRSINLIVAAGRHSALSASCHSPTTQPSVLSDHLSFLFPIPDSLRLFPAPRGFPSFPSPTPSTTSALPASREVQLSSSFRLFSALPPALPLPFGSFRRSSEELSLPLLHVTRPPPPSVPPPTSPFLPP